MIVRIDYPESGVRLDLWGGTSGTFSGLDLFNRIIDQRWQNNVTTTPADIDRYQYGYDRDSNRQYKANVVGTPVVSGGLDEYYVYDRLNRLTQMQRGVLNSGKTGIGGTPAREMDWTLDPTGNWPGYVTKTSGTTDLSQSRTSNKVNEITNVTESTGPSWVVPAYDAAGNTTTMPQVGDPTQSFTASYDAWNRMTGVSAGGSTVATYRYDGQNRRIVKVTTATSETRHFYFTNNWQDVEERVGTATSTDRQYVWGLRYVDELVCRDDATPQRLYALQDANFNVTAITDAAGAVQERFVYEPYGTRTFRSASWGSAVDAYMWLVGFQGGRSDLDSQLIQLRNRDLHTRLGQWTTRYPVADASLDLYQFVTSNPIRYLDPLGEATCDNCGADITSKLLAIDTDVQAKWGALSFFAKMKLDAKTVTPPWSVNLWDIAGMPGESAGSSPCASGTGACAGTVTVNGSCYFQPDVNYWLGGVIYNVLQQSWWTVDDAKVFEFEMIAYTSARLKHTDQKQRWFFAGARGNPFGVAPPAELTGCVPCTSPQKSMSWSWDTLWGTV